jgi:hypothetical protein
MNAPGWPAFRYAGRVRLILASGVEITGVEDVSPTGALLKQLDQQRVGNGWIVFERTIRRQGLLQRQTIRLRANAVVGVISEDTTRIVVEDETDHEPA